MKKYNATSYQKRLWFLYQADKLSTAYTVGIAVMLDGHLQRSVLEKSLNSVIKKHEIFRSKFYQEKNDVFQAIAPKLEVTLRVADMDSEKIDDFISEELAVPFDLENGPLIKAALLPISNLRHVLCITCHHIIVDESSIEIILKDISSEYNSRLLSSSQAHHCDSEIQSLKCLRKTKGENVAQMEKGMDFWKQNLKGLPSVCTLPTDYLRSSTFTYAGKTIRFKLSKDIFVSLKKLFLKNGCSPFVGFLSIFELLLYRYTYQKDIVLGSPFSDRLRFDLGGVVGFYSNTLILRTILRDEDSFLEIMTKNRNTVLSAYEHSDIPFEKIVDAIACDRSLEKNPLFQVMFTYNPYISHDDVKFDGLETKIQPIDYNTSKFDLTLFVNELADGIELVFEYSTELFKEERIRNLAKHYEELAKAILRNPNQKIEEIDFLPEQEKELLVSNFGRGREEVKEVSCLQEVFEEKERENGNGVAVVCNEEELSYSRLNEKANQLGHYLRRCGVRPNDLIAVLLERSIQLPVAILGILKSGAAYVPLDMDYPSERIAFMLEDAKTKVVVTHSKFAKVFSRYKGRVIYLDEVDLSAEDIENPTLINTERDIAYVIYTSGSTGIPKGVMVEHRNVYRLMKTSEKFYDFSKDDVWAWFHSYAFDFSVWEMWGAWFYGGKLCVVPYVVSRSPELLYKFLEESGVTVLNQTPSAFKNLVSYDSHGSNNLKLRYIIFGGEALNNSALKEWIGRYGDQKPKLVNMYGITETTVHATYKLLSKKDLDEKGSLIGEPLPDLEIYVMDEREQLVPIGVKGEMYVGGGGVTRGYLNRDELTRERYVAHPFRKGERIYKTGDLGRYRFDGSLEYCGRKDRQVKIRGYRIETGEIESEILRNPEVGSAYVRGVKENDTESLVAYIVLKSKEEEGFIGRLKEELKKRLPPYMIPSAFMVLEKLPLTASGKILEEELPLPEVHERQSVDEYVEARTESEKQLAEIWKDVLKLKSVGIRDNFFSLGGDSILALKMIFILRKRYNYDLELRDIFQYPTIERQSLQIKAFSKNVQAASRRISDQFRVSPLQKRFWILYCLFPNHVYNIHMSWEMKGELNASVLKEAFVIFLKRYKFLMSCFRLENDELVGYYSNDFDKCFRYVSCASRREAFELLESISKTIFRLDEGHFFIGYLINIGREKYIFSIITHHIVFDGNLKNILNKELSEIYDSLLLEGGRGLPSSFSGERYVEDQMVHDEKYEDQRNYWITNLADLADNYRIAPDFTPSASPTFNGRCFRFFLSEALKNEVIAMAAKERISLFSFLLTVFQSLAICYSGGDEFVVGIPSSVNALKYDSVTSMSVNTLPIRLQLGRKDTFLDAARRVQQTVLSALQHQEMPFDEIVSALNKNFSLEHNPVFQSMFMLEFDTSDGLKLGNLKIKSIELDSTISKFDLTFLARVRDNSVECIIEYSTDLYKSSTISKFAHHFQRFLKNIVNSESCDKSIFKLMANQEEDELLYSALNNTDRILDENIPVYKLIESQMQKKACNTAVFFGKQMITYEKLKSLSDAVAVLLYRSKVCRNFPISICMERSFEMVAAILGVWKYGGFYLPIDPYLPDDRVSYILGDSKTSTVITTTNLKQTLFKNFVGNVICMDDFENTFIEDCIEFSQELDSPAYMIYTSGSTGAPKGVLINHSSLLNVIEFFADYCQVSDRTFWLAESSISFDISVLELMLPLAYGGKIYVASREEQKDPCELKKIFKNYLISHFQATPTLLKLLADVRWIPERSITILSGGESLSSQLALYFLKYVPRMINVYGPTETTIWSSAGLVDKSSNITIGRPIYNTYFYILNSAFQKVPIGVPGDLYIGGKGIADCYWNRQELTAQKFIENPFRNGEKMYCTGDRVRCLRNGEIEYLNRSDSQIKLRGYRIELGEIEKNIENFSGVLVAAVNVVDSQKRAMLVAYIQPKSKEDVRKDEIRLFLNSTLPNYMIPDEIIIVDSIPKLPNGKINRKALSTYEHLTQKGEEIRHTTPKNYLQVILKSIWLDVLGCSDCDIYSNFFEIGGNSLLVVRLMTELKRVLDVQLSVVEIFQHPTIAYLSEYIEAKKEHTPICVISRENDKLSPIFFVHPAGGSAHPYFAMKRYISDRAIYGISDIYAGLPESPLNSINDMARFYVQEIDKIYKTRDRNYILIGWSF